MKVYLRGKVWWGQWSVDGRRDRVSSGTSDERLAREILAKKYAECFRQRTQGVVARKTWQEATTRYLREHEHLKCYSVYAAQSVWWTQQFERRKIVYVDQITPDEVISIRDKLYSTPKPSCYSKTQRRPGSVNRIMAYLRAVVNAAYREYRWFGQASPPLFRMLRGEHARIRYITPEEFERLVKELPEAYGRAARLAVSTGLRQSNVMNLRWDQVDEVGRAARIDGVQMKNGESLSIPLNDEALAVLRLQRNDGEWVFPGRRKGLPLGKISHRVWTAACQRAGLEDFHWHDLRHTWASWLRQHGASTDMIQQLGGWRDTEMVQRYAHLSLEHLRGAASLIDTTFSRKPTENGTDLTQYPYRRRHLKLVSG